MHVPPKRPSLKHITLLSVLQVNQEEPEKKKSKKPTYSNVFFIAKKLLFSVKIMSEYLCFFCLY